MPRGNPENLNPMRPRSLSTSSTTMDERDLALTTSEEQQEPRALRSTDTDEGDSKEVTKPEQDAATEEPKPRLGDTGTLGTRLFDQILSVMEAPPGEEGTITAINDALELVRGIPRKGSVEMMLTTQMIATHFAAMRCLRLAVMHDQTFAGRELFLKHATKLMRTYTAQVEALGKYRNKAKQTVVVKHVHVNEGGQAIVGNVDRGKGQGG